MPACLRSAVGLLGTILVALPAAATDVTHQPASEGRPITPAGELIRDLATHEPAVGALPVALVRSPDTQGPDGRGRYLVAVNSGFGVQFSAATNRAQQSLTVIDLAAHPPVAVQNVYFPSPQSANVGAVFGPRAPAADGWPLYVSGGFENKVWVFTFRPGERVPLEPASPGPASKVNAPAIDVTAMATAPPVKAYNFGKAAVYPTGLAISPDGSTLFTANNLGDTLGIVSGLGGETKVSAMPLGLAGATQAISPYAVVVTPGKAGAAAKAYVSLWGGAAVAVVRLDRPGTPVKHIVVAAHPTAMTLNRAGSRLYVVGSNDDAVSVIDTARDAEIERVDLRLAEKARLGATPEDLALDATGARLYVASAHANAVAVVDLSPEARGEKPTMTRARKDDDDDDAATAAAARSRVAGFIPTGQYPSAVAVVGETLIVGNGKGTGFANSSMAVDNSGRAPNAPNYRFPADRAYSRGQYDVSLISGNFSAVPLPDERRLAEYSRQVMRNDGVLGARKAALFPGPSPITHVIYVIRENRTYDQVFGDLAKAGNGSPADGDASLAIFGDGEAARVYGGPPQRITPNAHALALRFGLLDRFFVNSEASPDGHNWSTAAFSSDYVDKAFRWNYSGRGRSFDFQGFNRLPEVEPPEFIPDPLARGADAGAVADYLKEFVPYLHGDRDVAEPETLYLWDAAARAGLTYRNYGEFLGTVTQADVDALNAHKRKAYPDTSPVVAAFATKKSLEGHFSPTFPYFDLTIPDVMTADSYHAAKTQTGTDPTISPANPDPRFRGTSRFAVWLQEFEGFVRGLEAGAGDGLPNLSIVWLPSDHTSGLHPEMATPQFMVADNDYALGRLVEAVSKSPYWKDTAILVVEDDAQAGPDHVDAHRSPALVISAYNRPGALVHTYHNTVSLIRTIELLLGLPPMNQLDAAAAPIDVFQATPDLAPYTAVLPDVALDNLIVKRPTNGKTAYWIRRTEEQDLTHPDMADPAVLNAAIWYSVRGGGVPLPAVASLPAFDLMTAGLRGDNDEEEAREVQRIDARKRELIARLLSRR
jgi:DNA-binding beta-propeller fold protein YncE